MKPKTTKKDLKTYYKVMHQKRDKVKYNAYMKEYMRKRAAKKLSTKDDLQSI